MRRLTFAVVAVPFLLCALAACSKPEPPSHDAPPDPQAAAPAAVAQPGALQEAIRQPIDQAKDVRAQTEQAGQDQRKTIDDATGG
jgi:hypothetical protein